MTVWVPLAMPHLRSQQSVLSGLGVAGAVLAAVVVTFALASGIIAYSLTSAEPLAASSSALVLDPLRVGERAAAPLVLRRAPASADGVSARAAAAPPAPNGGAAGSLSPATGGVTPTAGPPDAGSGATGAPSATAQPTPGVLPRRPVGEALEDTTQAVAATTDSLTLRLDATGDATRELVHTAADRTAAALARLLGIQPQR